VRGLKGGKARAEKLTPEQRAEIARRAAAKTVGRSQPGIELGIIFLIFARF
jgi:hypothetical protein